MRRAVFFDRDGVLNEADVRNGKPHPPSGARELRIVPDARMAVASVRNAGLYAIAITNQPDVARGSTTRESVEEINELVAAGLRLDGVYSCFHDDADHCDCRKPKAGLLRQAADDFNVDLSGSYMVGDRTKDVECGRAAGCTTVFIDFGYAETPAHVRADVIAQSLPEAIEAILSREAKRP